MEIKAKSIPGNEQRYETAGDYTFHADNTVNISVSHMQKVDYEFLVALHEIIESWLVKMRGISEPEIMAFDIAFNESGKAGEPGDDPEAPYYREHQFATAIEKLMCNEMGIRWCDYDNAVESLFTED
jgi:hypothetical protein